METKNKIIIVPELFKNQSYTVKWYSVGYFKVK